LRAGGQSTQPGVHHSRHAGRRPTQVRVRAALHCWRPASSRPQPDHPLWQASRGSFQVRGALTLWQSARFGRLTSAEGNIEGSRSDDARLRPRSRRIASTCERSGAIFMPRPARRSSGSACARQEDLKQIDSVRPSCKRSWRRCVAVEEPVGDKTGGSQPPKRASLEYHPLHYPTQQR